MPNKEGFRTNFNQANFESGKEAYFVELTGYSNDEVSESLDKMNDLLATLYDKYPQLKYNGENKEFIERVIGKADFIVEENLALAGKKPSLPSLCNQMETKNDRSYCNWWSCWRSFRRFLRSLGRCCYRLCWCWMGSC